MSESGTLATGEMIKLVSCYSSSFKDNLPYKSNVFFFWLALAFVRSGRCVCFGGWGWK